jgi:FkbM family methyltransferase
MLAPAVDLTGGIESSMGRTFERAGYVTSAPSAWLHKPGQALRMTVPCVPLSWVLTQAGLTRLDIMWLDVEGGELAVLQSIEWTKVSIGILVVSVAILQ